MFYIVSGRVDYENAEVDSTKLFFFEDEALAYGESLIRGDSPRYNNYMIVERELE